MSQEQSLQIYCDDDFHWSTQKFAYYGWNIIIEPHGRGVPEAILNDRSPRPGLPEFGRSPHEGRPGRGERSLSMAEGTNCCEVLFLLHPSLCNISLNKAENSDI